MKEYEIYTIGYTAFPSPDEFLSALKLYQISCLIDVRSYPTASEFYAFYSRSSLEPFLKKNKIIYRNYANEFGARQENRNYYNNVGCLDFKKFSESPEFISGVEKLKKGLDLNYKFALMCAEKDPISCHRTIMVSRALSLQGFKIYHILQNKSFETQKDIDMRLLQEYKLEPSFLQTQEEQIAEAYYLKNLEIGYKGNGENK